MMDIRRAAALLLALVMIAALTVGCGKKQSDTPTDTPAAGADGRTPAQQPAKLVCYNGSVTLRFVREEDTWYWGDDRDFPLEQSIVTELLATVQGYAALSPLPHTDDLSQFGLSDTKRYISLTDTEGNTRTYWLGTQTDEGQYIQPEDETDAVYLSPAGVDGTLNMGIYDMDGGQRQRPDCHRRRRQEPEPDGVGGRMAAERAGRDPMERNADGGTGTADAAAVHRLSAQHRGGGAVRADGAGGDADGHLPGYCRRDGADAAGGRPAGRRVLCHGE